MTPLHSFFAMYWLFLLVLEHARHCLTLGSSLKLFLCSALPANTFIYFACTPPPQLSSSLSLYSNLNEMHPDHTTKYSHLPPCSNHLSPPFLALLTLFIKGTHHILIYYTIYFFTFIPYHLSPSVGI